MTVWEIATGRIVAHHNDHDNPVVFLGFCLDDKALVGWEGTGLVWIRALDQPGSRRVLPGVESHINSVALSPDGRLLATAAGEQPVTIWDLSSGAKEHSYLANDHAVDQVEFSPDSTSLIIGCKSPVIRIWSFLHTPDMHHALAGHSKATRTLAFSDDGSLLASGSDDNTIKLWSVDSERELLTLRGHSQAVSALAFSPRSDRLASVSLDGKVILWEFARTGREGLHLQFREDMLSAGNDSLLALSVSSDGQHLAEAGFEGIDTCLGSCEAED